MGTLGRRIIVGILMAIAGTVMAAVAIWILADPPYFPLFPPGSVSAGESPKVGIAAGIIALIVGLVCCFVRMIEEENGRKYIVVAAVLVVLALTLASFGLAVKDHLAVKQLDDYMAHNRNAEAAYFGNRQSGNRNNSLRQRNRVISELLPRETLKKIKIQLMVMAVAASIGAIFEIVAMIIAFIIRPSASNRNAMQMERTF